MSNLFFWGTYRDALVMYKIYRSSLLCELDIDKDLYYHFEKDYLELLLDVNLLFIRTAKRKLKCADMCDDEPASSAGERKLQIIRWDSLILPACSKKVFLVIILKLISKKLLFNLKVVVLLLFVICYFLF